MNRLERRLIDSGYTPHGAHSAAEHISAMTDERYRTAIALWAQYDRMTPLCEGGYTTDELMRHFHMTYPAAVLFLDWYAKDSESARRALALGGERQ